MARSVWGRRAGFPPLAPLLVAVAVTAIAVGLLMAGRNAGPPLSGRAVAVDGDTLRLGARRIRLTGLDAPELDQTCTDASGRDWQCGAKARAFVADALAGRNVSCTSSGHDIYGRTLASCRIGDADLGMQIVSAGWAVADFGYLGQEASAHAAGRGIWSGSFVAPAEWRRTHGTAEPTFWDWIRNWFQ